MSLLDAQTPARRWWVLLAESPQGPFDESVVVEWLKSGQIASSALICLDGTQQWQLPENWPAFRLAIEASAQSRTPVTSPHEVTASHDSLPEFNPSDPRYHYRRSKRDRDLAKWAFWIPWPVYVVLRFFNWLRP